MPTRRRRSPPRRQLRAPSLPLACRDLPACSDLRGALPSARRQVLSSAIALPLQQLVLCAQPLLGARAESFFWGDGLALGLVLVGFAVNQGCSPEGRAARRPAGQRVEPAPTSASESERQYVAATFE